MIRISKIAIEGTKRTETICFPDNSQYGKIVSVADDSGAILSSEQFDGSDSLVFTIAYQYDDKGNCTTATYRNPDGTIAFESAFEYGKSDEKGNWLERTEYCSYADVGNRIKDTAQRKIEYAEE